jgi:hypothetical protein
MIKFTVSKTWPAAPVVLEVVAAIPETCAFEEEFSLAVDVF